MSIIVMTMVSVSLILMFVFVMYEYVTVVKKRKELIKFIKIMEATRPLELHVSKNEFGEYRAFTKTDSPYFNGTNVISMKRKAIIDNESYSYFESFTPLIEAIMTIIQGYKDLTLLNYVADLYDGSKSIGSHTFSLVLDESVSVTDIMSELSLEKGLLTGKINRSLSHSHYDVRFKSPILSEDKTKIKIDFVVGSEKSFNIILKIKP